MAFRFGTKASILARRWFTYYRLTQLREYQDAKKNRIGCNLIKVPKKKIVAFRFWHRNFDPGSLPFHLLKTNSTTRVSRCKKKIGCCSKWSAGCWWTCHLMLLFYTNNQKIIVAFRFGTEALIQKKISCCCKWSTGCWWTNHLMLIFYTKDHLDKDQLQPTHSSRSSDKPKLLGSAGQRPFILLKCRDTNSFP